MLISGADAFLIPLTIADLAMLVIYLVRCFATRGYLFSIFNIVLFQFIMELVISPVFLTDDHSWRSLWVESAGLMTNYTITSLFVNLFGFCVFLAVLNVSQRLKHEHYGKFTIRTAEAIDITGVNALTVIVVAAFVAICFVGNGTFPLFNGQRGFSNGTVFAMPYTIITRMLPALGLFYGVRTASRVGGWMGFVACAACLFLTGNRESVFLVVLLPTFLMWIYKTGDVRKTSVAFMRSLRRKLPIVIFAISAVVVSGLVYANIRIANISAGTSSSALEEMLYGNTFSDIRDGAYILRGMDYNGGNLLDGKTYQAALAILLPRHFGDFKSTFLYGAFTTQTLFGWIGHFGLRGGWFLESYLNFGIIGVACFGIAMGCVFSRLEGIFSEVFLKSGAGLRGSEVFLPFVLYELLRCLICSSEIWGLYSAILVVVLLEFLSLPAVLRRSEALRGGVVTGRCSR